MNRSAFDTVERRLHDLVREAGVDPTTAPGEVADLVERVLDTYERDVEVSSLERVADRETVKRSLIDGLAGLGPLQPLMDDPRVEEIWVNGPGRVFYARDGEHVLSNIVLRPQETRELVERMLRVSGRRVDLSSPFVDATLADGSRLHVVVPDITRKHWAINIRKFVVRANRLEELVRLGSLPAAAARFLRCAVEAGLNIVVAGGTQTGKTTMLNCLASAVPPRHRVITCEEVFELQVQLPDVVAMQTRPQNLEGQGDIPLRRLVVEALRMRPDRIIVGEVRQAEALDLLVALNSGLPGMTSIHANSAREALTKLATLPLLAGENVGHSFIVPTVASCIHIVVHLVRDRNGRRTNEIVGVTGRVESGVIETVPLWTTQDGRLVSTGAVPPRQELFASAGMDVRTFLG